MSRTSKPTRWPFQKRSKLGPVGGRSRRPLAHASRWTRHLDFEGLENRSLLSINYTVTGTLTSTTVTFTSSTLTDELYLAENTQGDLEWYDQSTPSSSPVVKSDFSLVVSGANGVGLQDQDTTINTLVPSTIKAQTSSDNNLTVPDGGVFLENTLGSFFTGGFALNIQAQSLGSSNQLLAIQSKVDTQGGNFTVSGYSNVTLGTPASGSQPALGATISTRSLGGGTDYVNDASEGNSGALSMTVANPDPNNPFLNVGFDTPQITVEPGSELLAQATGTYQAGNLTLNASNQNYVLDGLSFPMEGATLRQSAVDFMDSSSGSPTRVEGGTIDIEANSGDIPLVQTLANPNLDNPNSSDQAPSWGPWVSGLLDSALQLAGGALPVFNLATLPVSINYRNAGSTITVGQDTQIIGSGDVTLDSTSTADAEGQAIWRYNTQFGLAFAFEMGQTDAEMNVDSNALVDSTGGTVNLYATANTTAEDTARVSQNIGTSPTNIDDVAIALGVGVVDQTADATVAQYATVKAADDLNLVATGTGLNTSIPTTGTYITGTAGVAAGINVTINNITSKTDGTMISGANTAERTLTLDPIKNVDFAKSAIQVSPSAMSGFQTGQAYTYSSGDNGPIGGLTSGNTYYIIVPTTLTNEIQLATSLANAESGTFVPFRQYSTLTDGTITVPISDVDETTGTIQFDSSPFTNGEVLTYHAAPGEAIGGLTDGSTYDAIVTQASPNTLQLAAPSAPTTALPLNLDPEFQGVRQSLPVTVNPSGLPVDSIEFKFNAGFQLGDSFIYQGSGIDGLNDGVRYWAIPNASNPDVIQLASSLANAQANTAVPIGSNAGGSDGSAQLVFDPSVSIDSTTNTIDLGFNYALAGTLPTGTPLVYYGALGTVVANLTDGTTYYMIQDSANPRIMRLTTSASRAQQAYTAGTTALTANATAVATSFPVSINSSTNPANSLDFGSQGSFYTGEALIYEGPSGSNPSITGLTAGAIYYALIPDPTNSPGVIQLTDATGAVQQISLPNGVNSTTVNIVTADVAAGLTGGAIASARVGNLSPVGTFPVTVDPTGQTVDFGFNAGFERNEPLVYEGPASGYQGLSGLTVGQTYYISLPDRVNHPGMVQFYDSFGDLVPVALASGTTTTVMFGSPTSDNVSVSSNEITFNNPDSSTPFDPGLNTGDPFVYLGPVLPPGDVGITGLTPGNISGTIYYVKTTPTPGVIELTDSSGNLVQFSLPSGTTSTNINYAVPFTPTDTRPLVVTQFGPIDTSTMAFPSTFTASPTTLTPQGTDAGINISATVAADNESSFASSGIGNSPAWQDKATKPEVLAPWVNSAISQRVSVPFTSSSTNSTADSSPADIWSQSDPGATADSPDSSGVGAFFLQVVPVDNVTAEVQGDAVIESATNVAVAASLTQTVDTSVAASLTAQDGGFTNSSGDLGTAAALALGIGYYAPTVHAMIDDGAQVDAAGTVSVTATTSIPFEIPNGESTPTAQQATAAGWAGDVTYSPGNPNYNPVNFLTGVFSDSMFGLGTDILNNVASAKVNAGQEFDTAFGGNIQVFVYENDTRATIGDAEINQNYSKPNALGPGQGIVFRNTAQSVTVMAKTIYQNAAEAGAFDLNLGAATYLKLHRSQSFGGSAGGVETTAAGKAPAGALFDLYGDTKGQNAIGASAFIDVLNNYTYATIDTGAKIGVGSAGMLDVDADLKIFAFTLAQSGDAGGNVGVAGMVSWYNVDNHTKAQIQDGVTVNGGPDASGNTLPGGTVVVHADDNTTLVGISGSAVKGNHIGVGFAMSVNNLNTRSTLAIIGAAPGDQVPTPAPKGSYDVAALQVTATDEGQIGTATYAAASIAASEGQVASNSQPDPTASIFSGKPNSSWADEGLTDPLQQQSGLGISGAVSANVMNSDTEAYINDPGTFTTPAARALSLDPTAQPTTVINFSQPPNLPTGTAVVYTAASPIGNLTSGDTYYVIAIDPYDLELAATTADAAAGNAIELDPASATGTQTLTPASGEALTFSPTSVEATILDFAAPHRLQTGQALEYTAGSGAIGGLTGGQTYYAIVVGPNQLELANSFANATAGIALAQDFSQASGTQTFVPSTFSISATTNTIVVSIVPSIALSEQQAGPSTSGNTAVAGSFSTDDVIDTTKAYLENATVTTSQLNVTADHGGYIGSLSFGGAGTSAAATFGGTGSSTAVAGCVSIDIDLPDTEAYVKNAHLTLGGDSSVTAQETAEIVALAGSGAYSGSAETNGTAGSSKGFGVTIAINLLGAPGQPALTTAYVLDSTVTLAAGTLSVKASDEGATVQPRIIAISASGGVATGEDSTGAGRRGRNRAGRGDRPQRDRRHHHRVRRQLNHRLERHGDRERHRHGLDRRRYPRRRRHNRRGGGSRRGRIGLDQSHHRHHHRLYLQLTGYRLERHRRRHDHRDGDRYLDDRDGVRRRGRGALRGRRGRRRHQLQPDRQHDPGLHRQLHRDDDRGRHRSHGQFQPDLDRAGHRRVRVRRGIGARRLDHCQLDRRRRRHPPQHFDRERAGGLGRTGGNGSGALGGRRRLDRRQSGRRLSRHRGRL
jgi:hypothetical protein